MLFKAKIEVFLTLKIILESYNVLALSNLINWDHIYDVINLCFGFVLFVDDLDRYFIFVLLIHAIHYHTSIGTVSYHIVTLQQILF